MKYILIIALLLTSTVFGESLEAEVKRLLKSHVSREKLDLIESLKKEIKDKTGLNLSKRKVELKKIKCALPSPWDLRDYSEKEGLLIDDRLFFSSYPTPCRDINDSYRASLFAWLADDDFHVHVLVQDTNSLLQLFESAKKSTP